MRKIDIGLITDMVRRNLAGARPPRRGGPFGDGFDIDRIQAAEEKRKLRRMRNVELVDRGGFRQ